jgi:PAS domain S-box-containing protein
MQLTGEKGHQIMSSGNKPVWFKSILFKTTLLSWSLIIVTLAIFVMVILPYQETILQNEMESNARFVTETIEHFIDAPFTKDNIDFLKDYCGAILKNNESIKYIILSKQNGFSIIQTSNKWIRDTLKSSWFPPRDSVVHMEYIENDEFGGEVFRYSEPANLVGGWDWIQVGISTRNFNADIRSLYYRTIILAMVLILVGLIVSLFFSRRIVKPISRLNEVVRHVTSGNMSVRAEIKTGDELQDLATSFNLMTDVLKRSRYETIDANKYTENIIKSMASSLLVANPDLSIRTVNKATVELLGYTENELLQKSARDIILGDSERGLGLDDLLKKGFLKDVPLFYATKEGKKIPVSFSGSVMYKENGTVQGIVCLAQDITERKDAEEALIRAHDELEIRVAERTYELEKANESLESEVKDRKSAEEKVTVSLHEKEVLLKEIHHRVKNNLQVISSLLFLNSRNIKDKEALSMFQDSQNRVKSIALVHERLYKSKDLGRIDLKEYINLLTVDLATTFGINRELIQLQINIQDVTIGIDYAVPCGLIINELISNSLKYAFPNGNSGYIKVEVIMDEEKNYILTVADNGIGLPEGIDIKKLNSLGLQLVNNLVRQLEGNFEFSGEGGTTFKIIFKESTRKRK